MENVNTEFVSSALLIIAVTANVSISYVVVPLVVCKQGRRNRPDQLNLSLASICQIHKKRLLMLCPFTVTKMFWPIHGKIRM